MEEQISTNQLINEGKAAYRQGDFIQAARAFDAAAESLDVSGDVLNAAEMRNNSSVAYLRAGEVQAALRAVQGTPAVFASAGDVRRQGLALGNFGAALEAMNRLDDAVKAYSQSADLLASVGENDLRAYVMKSLSALQLRSGRHIEALSTMQAGLDGIEQPKTQERLLKRLLKVPFKFMGK